MEGSVSTRDPSTWPQSKHILILKYQHGTFENFQFSVLLCQFVFEKNYEYLLMLFVLGY
jgi:hypothetical protein